METQVTTNRTAQLVNVGEAVSPSTLYGWVWQRRISYIKVDHAVRFDMADLERFVAENRIRARLPAKF